MSVDRYAFDTNILVYALDERDPVKHQLARTLTGQADPKRCLVPLQTLGELCSLISRKHGDLLPQAERLALAFPRLFRVLPSSHDDLHDALAAHNEHGLQFWDAMLWATVRRAGCKLLLTEDLQDGRSLGGVLFRNPFSFTQQEIASLRS